MVFYQKAWNRVPQTLSLTPICDPSHKHFYTRNSHLSTISQGVSEKKTLKKGRACNIHFWANLFSCIAYIYLFFKTGYPNDLLKQPLHPQLYTKFSYCQTSGLQYHHPSVHMPYPKGGYLENRKPFIYLAGTSGPKMQASAIDMNTSQSAKSPTYPNQAMQSADHYSKPTHCKHKQHWQPIHLTNQMGELTVSPVRYQN